MRLPSFSTVVRTFYTISNSTARILPASQRALAPLTRGTVIKSMPTIPFLSSFFSTSSSSNNMSFPLQKSDNEWQAVLNPGMPFLAYHILAPDFILTETPRAVSHPPPERHRSPLHWGLRQAHALFRCVYMRSLRCTSVQSNPQVQVRLRMASVLR